MAGRGADVLLGGLLQRLAEDRVLEEVGDAHPLQEGQPGLLQVARLPAGDEGVDGDDDRAVAGDLGAADEALDEAAVVRPVELEPARPLAAGLGDLLEGEVGGGAGDHRHAERRGGAGGRQLAVLVDDLLDADRRQQQRRRHRGAEHGRREVALGDVAQHPRHDPAAPEGLAVGVNRLLAAGAGEDVGGRASPPSPRGPPLELGDRDRDRGRLAAEAAGVDLAVVVGGVRHAGGRLFIDSRSVIDSHTHLFLCEGEEDELVAAAETAGVRRMLNVGLDAETNAVALAAAERHEGVFADGRLPPDRGRRVRRRARREIARARRAREGAGDRRDRPRLLPRDARAARSSGAPSSAQIEIADRARPADRDPRPRPRRRERRGRRVFDDPRRARGRGRR